MRMQHIALVCEAEGVDGSELSRVSAALQRQITDHLRPAWGALGTVDPFLKIEDVPRGYWPLVLTREAPTDGFGNCADGGGKPPTRVRYSSNWSLEASRACLDILINPDGTRTVSAPSPRAPHALSLILVEACAPCSGLPYFLSDVLVSDFALPVYYGSVGAGRRDRYSHRGALTQPFQVAEGGHLSWFEPETGTWWRRTRIEDRQRDARLVSRGSRAQLAKALTAATARDGEPERPARRALSIPPPPPPSRSSRPPSPPVAARARLPPPPIPRPAGSSKVDAPVPPAFPLRSFGSPPGPSADKRSSAPPSPIPHSPPPVVQPKPLFRGVSSRALKTIWLSFAAALLLAVWVRERARITRRGAMPEGLTTQAPPTGQTPSPLARAKPFAESAAQLVPEVTPLKSALPELRAAPRTRSAAPDVSLRARRQTPNSQVEAVEAPPVEGSSVEAVEELLGSRI